MQDQKSRTYLLRSFFDIGAQLTQDLDINQVLLAIVERSMELTGARYGAAVTLSPAGEIEDFLHRGLTTEQVAALPHLPEGRGLLGLVLQKRESIRIESISDHSESVGFPNRHVPMKAFLGVPLMDRGHMVGALYLTKPPGEPEFTPDDEELFTALGAVAAIGIVNARLFSAETLRAERGALLQDLASRVRMSLDTGEVLGATVQELGRIAGVDRCFFRSAGDPSTGVLGPIEYEWDAPGMESLRADPERQYPVASLAAMTGTTQWSNDVTQDDRLLDGEVPGTVHDLMDTNTRSALSAPLRWGDELLGVVTLLCAAPRNWSSLDVELIEAAANEASVALHHAHLYAKAVETATELERLDELRRDFISMISHELRSPMTVVAGIADLFQKHWERLSDENRKELVDTLGRESRRLTRLVTEVLDLEAIDGGRVDLLVEEVNLAALTGESIVDGGQAGQAHLVGGGGDATVQADRDRIKQVLLNLLSNAAKFSSEGSPITVEVVPEDDSVCVSVTDQGPGIAEEDMPRLFQRFSRLQSPVPQPGSGLGLYLSRVLINRHGGDIWVDSEPDEGSTFTFRLPRRPPA